VARVTSLPHEPSHNMPVLAGHNYSIPTLSQPNYNASRYQVGADVFDFADSLDPNRKADISSVPWLQNTTSFSHEYNNRLDLFYNTFAYAYQNDLVNIDTIKTTTCFGQETSRYPDVKRSTVMKRSAMHRCSATVSSARILDMQLPRPLAVT
jgi:hypothetical protein